MSKTPSFRRERNKIVVSKRYDASVKFHHRSKNAYGDTNDIFCLESPPTLRSIKFLDRNPRFRLLAFPWIYYFAGFTYKNYSLLSVFYGKSSIKDQKTKLFIPYLSHMSGGWPHNLCMNVHGGAIIDDDNWADKVLGTFWESAFRWGGGYEEGYGRHAYEVATGAAKINLSLWTSISKSKKWENRITQFPWLPASFDNGREACVESMMGYFKWQT